MNDTIYRQRAIDTIKELREVAWKNWHEPTLSPSMVIDALSDLPSAPTRTGEWIPVTERLPETDGEVLITVLDMEEDYVEVYKGFYQDQEWWTQWCHGCLKIKDEPCGENIVTAWMPLPQPYTEDSEDA